MKILFFDTETTGLIKNSIIDMRLQPRIIEFCGIVMDTETWETVKELNILVNPQVSLTRKITEITGLTDADLTNKRIFAFFSTIIRDMIESVDRAVSHNVSFDSTMVINEFNRIGKEITFPELQCTVEETEYIKGMRMSLKDLWGHLFDEPMGNQHRAKDDVLEPDKNLQGTCGAGNSINMTVRIIRSDRCSLTRLKELLVKSFNEFPHIESPDILN